jgi:hypothetical protein
MAVSLRIVTDLPWQVADPSPMQMLFFDVGVGRYVSSSVHLSTPRPVTTCPALKSADLYRLPSTMCG